MDDNRDECLLASCRRWAIDAVILEHLVKIAEKEARKNRWLYPDRTLSECFAD